MTISNGSGAWRVFVAGALGTLLVGACNAIVGVEDLVPKGTAGAGGSASSDTSGGTAGSVGGNAGSSGSAGSTVASGTGGGSGGTAGASGSSGTGGTLTPSDGGMRDVVTSDAPPGDGAPSDCPALSSPQGGTVAVGARTPGSMALYSCTTGNNLVGPDTLTCGNNGQWDRTPPTCKIVDCGALAQPAQGAVSVPATTYGSIATYSCPVGFGTVPGATRTCQANGMWSGSVPTCVPANCPALSAPGGGFVATQALTYGSTATYSCSTGYTMSGAATRTCQTDGTWSGAAPTCTIKNCGALANPTNGTVSAATTTYGSIATYGCSNGYTPSGPLTRTCLDTAMWSGTAPVCNIINCGALANPTGGTVSAPSTTFGSTASYTCSGGFVLVGSGSRSCQANGAWSGTAPTCASPGNCNLKVLTDTLALWPFDDGTGQVVRDIGPNAKHGTLGSQNAVETADPTWTQGGRFVPVGLAFAGAQSDYVHVSTAVPFPNNTFTVEVWIKPTGGNYAQFFTAGFSVFLAMTDNGTDLEWGVSDGLNYHTDRQPAGITIGAWHYIAATYDGATMVAYVDGASIGSKATVATMPPPDDYNLGGRPFNTFLTGLLGPIRVSSTVHTAANIATTWQNALACPPP